MRQAGRTSGDSSFKNLYDSLEKAKLTRALLAAKPTSKKYPQNKNFAFRVAYCETKTVLQSHTFKFFMDTQWNIWLFHSGNLFQLSKSFSS